jgi:hypothetical protein
LSVVEDSANLAVIVDPTYEKGCIFANLLCPRTFFEVVANTKLELRESLVSLAAVRVSVVQT